MFLEKQSSYCSVLKKKSVKIMLFYSLHVVGLMHTTLHFAILCWRDQEFRRMRLRISDMAFVAKV